MCNRWASNRLRASIRAANLPVSLAPCYCAGKSRGNLMQDDQRASGLSSLSDEQCRNWVIPAACGWPEGTSRKADDTRSVRGDNFLVIETCHSCFRSCRRGMMPEEAISPAPRKKDRRYQPGRGLPQSRRPAAASDISPARPASRRGKRPGRKFYGQAAAA